MCLAEGLNSAILIKFRFSMALSRRVVNSLVGNKQYGLRILHSAGGPCPLAPQVFLVVSLIESHLCPVQEGDLWQMA